MKYTQALAKMAALGWKQDGTNITNRFADFDNEKLAQTAAVAGLSQGGLVGALTGYGAGKAFTKGERPDVEELPDFDPETGAYIGKSYAVPDTEEDMQKLHQRITGTAWEASAPVWLEWMLKKRKERIRNAIIKVLKDGKGNTEGMSHGEIASLVFPHVYKNDGTVARNLGFWKWKEFPVKGVFKSRPISVADIQEYEKEQKDKNIKQATFSGFKDADERMLVAKRLLLNAAMDISNREKDSFKNLFAKSPSIYYEMGWNDDNAEQAPVGRFYQKINGKDEPIALKDNVSLLAKICMELRQRNERFRGVTGELRPDMLNADYTMFKQNPNANVSILSAPEQLRKQASKPQWDPNGMDSANTEFAFKTTQVDKVLKDSLVKHYGSLLAKAYKESTGKVLENPQQHIDPRYSYIIGRAANVNPEILDKLNDFYYQRLAGWSTTGQNVDPGLAMDAAELANEDSGVYPLNYSDRKLKRDSKYVPGVKVKAELVDR